VDNVDKSELDFGKNNITIYQHNDFLTAKKDYSIVAQRICRMAIAAVRPHLSKNTNFHTKEFNYFFIETSELQKVFKETNWEKLNKKIELVVNELWKPIKVGDHRNFDSFVIFDFIGWKEKKGLTLKFSDIMKKFLIELDMGNYTKLQLKAAFQLSSTYALILLDLMLQYQGKAKKGIIERTLSIDDLRFSLNVPENAYADRIDNFRRIVLDYPIKEINEKTEFHIFPNYELLRGKYNKVTGFKFRMALPKVKEANESEEKASKVSEETDARDLVERLKRFGIHGRVAKRLATLENAEESFAIAMKYIRNGTVANKAAYIRKAIEEDYYGQSEEVNRVRREEWKREVERNNRNIAAATGKKPAQPAPAPFPVDPRFEKPDPESLHQIVIDNPDSPLGRIAKKALFLSFNEKID